MRAFTDTGIICSQKAGKILDFLQRAGATPFKAIVVATGLKPGDVNRGLNILRGAGYSYPEKRNGIEFWFPIQGPVLSDLKTQEAMTWFIARLEEAGGEYENGWAHYPSGIAFPIEVKGSLIKTGEFWAELDDLKQKSLSDCLKKAE
jgi:hypothetical protein